MRSIRLLILLALIGIALAAVRNRPDRTPGPTGAATPAECLDAYYDSLQRGDADAYLRCLDEPYREEAGRRTFDTARREVKEVKNVVQKAAPSESESPLWVDVDEVRQEGIRRRRYHLRQQDRGWVITAIDRPHAISSPIRYGTPVGNEPQDNAPLPSSFGSMADR